MAVESQELARARNAANFANIGSVIGGLGALRSYCRGYYRALPE